jgi:hypothetical protein
LLVKCLKYHQNTYIQCLRYMFQPHRAMFRQHLCLKSPLHCALGQIVLLRHVVGVNSYLQYCAVEMKPAPAPDAPLLSVHTAWTQTGSVQFARTSAHVGSVVGKVARGQVLSEYIGLHCELSCQQLLHIPNHPTD